MHKTNAHVPNHTKFRENQLIYTSLSRNTSIKSLALPVHAESRKKFNHFLEIIVMGAKKDMGLHWFYLQSLSSKLYSRNFHSYHYFLPVKFPPSLYWICLLLLFGGWHDACEYASRLAKVFHLSFPWLLVILDMLLTSTLRIKPKKERLLFQRRFRLFCFFNSPKTSKKFFFLLSHRNSYYEKISYESRVNVWVYESCELELRIKRKKKHVSNKI